MRLRVRGKGISKTEMIEGHELTHTLLDRNGGGVLVPVGVLGRSGRVWSIEEACFLMGRQAQFLYRGERVTRLSMLPSR